MNPACAWRFNPMDQKVPEYWRLDSKIRFPGRRAWPRFKIRAWGKKKKYFLIPNRMNLSEVMDRWIKRKETNAYRRHHYLNKWILFCYFCFFYGALNYLDIFLVQAYEIKCVKKANFRCTRRTRNVLSNCKKKKNSVDALNFKTKVQIIFQSKSCVLCVLGPAKPAK